MDDMADFERSASTSPLSEAGIWSTHLFLDSNNDNVCSFAEISVARPELKQVFCS